MSIRIHHSRLVTALAATATAAAVVIAGAGVAGARTQSTPPASPEPSTPSAPRASTGGTITVTGEGSVNVTPDTALVNIGVEAQASTGAAAMSLLDERSAALTDALIGAGVAEDDLQTTGLNLYSMYSDDGSTVTGYVASLQVNATIHDIDAVGPAIDAAQTAVGEGLTLGGVSFSFADPESVLGQARADAVHSAAIKAQQLADAAGVPLGAVIAIAEGTSSNPVVFAPAMADAEAGRGPTISAGNLDLTATVTVTYAIG